MLGWVDLLKRIVPVDVGILVASGINSPARVAAVSVDDNLGVKLVVIIDVLVRLLSSSTDVSVSVDFLVRGHFVFCDLIYFLTAFVDMALNQLFQF